LRRNPRFHQVVHYLIFLARNPVFGKSCRPGKRMAGAGSDRKQNPSTCFGLCLGNGNRIDHVDGSRRHPCSSAIKQPVSPWVATHWLVKNAVRLWGLTRRA
jgi:hypothetical protein